MAVSRPDEIAVLLEVNTRLAGGDPPAVLLPRIVEETQRLTGGDAVVIRLLERDQLVLVARSSRAEALDLEDRLPIGEGIAGAVARDGSPLICDDLEQEERLYGPHRPSVAAAGLRSSVTLPLRAGTGTIGTLSVYADRPAAFKGTSLDLFTAFADQAAIALEKARLLERARRQTARLVALHRIVAGILRQSDEDRTIRQILEEARGLLGVPGVALYLYDRARDALIARMATIPPGRYPDRVGVGEGVLGRVFRERTIIALDDYASSPLGLPRAKVLGTRALVAAPLVVGDAALGVLCAWSTDADVRFTTDDQQLILLFAEQAALALENARLRQAAAAEAEASASREITNSLLGMAEALAKASTTSDVARTLEEVAPQFYGSDATVVRLRRNDGSYQVVSAAGDWTEAERRFLYRQDPTASPLFERLATERRVLAVEDLAASGLVTAEEAAAVRQDSVLVMPLLAREHLLGFVGIHFRRGIRRFSTRDIALAEGIARQAAMALDTLRLRQRDWEAARLNGAMRATRSTAYELNEPLTTLCQRIDETFALAQQTPGAAPLLEHLAGVASAVSVVEEKVRKLQESIRLDRAW